jgi:hypothetical protein
MFLQFFSYGIVLGLGLAFSALMQLITFMMKKYLKEDQTDSETYLQGNRSVKMVTFICVWVCA